MGDLQSTARRGELGKSFEELMTRGRHSFATVFALLQLQPAEEAQKYRLGVAYARAVAPLPFLVFLQSALGSRSALGIFFLLLILALRARIFLRFPPDLKK